MKIFEGVRENVATMVHDGVLYVANNQYESLDACPTKGAFEVFGKRKSSRGAVALIFGGAYHAAMEAHLRGWPIADQIEVGLEYARTNGLGAVEDARRNYSTLESLIRMYNADYASRTSKFKPFEHDGELAIEKTFELPLGVIHLLYHGEVKQVRIVVRGKIDLLSYWKGDNLWVVDHKTTSVMGEQFTADKMRGSQFLLYTLGARTLAGPTVKGCVINVAAIRSKGFEFQQFDLPFPEWQVLEFASNMLARLQTIIQSIISTLDLGNYPTCRSSCVGKYGKCSFFDVCQVPLSKRSQLLYEPTLFVEETHNKETYDK